MTDLQTRGAVVSQDVPARDPMPILEAALERCIDALVETAVVAGDRATWLSWELGADGAPVRMTGGRRSMYDGDAGVGWALAQLGRATDRSDLTDLASKALASAERPSTVQDLEGAPPGGLLDGTAGLALARRSLPGGSPLTPVATGVEFGRPEQVLATDFTSGLAGQLYAQAKIGAVGAHTVRAVAVLGERALTHPIGVCWPDPLAADAASARPLVGLSHGNSGIALALAEAAAAYPPCAKPAIGLVREALRWEAAWFDSRIGGWPDLREGEISYPTLWCHGAAGIGAVRLRLLRLMDAGLELGASGDTIPAETLRAEAEVAVRACGTALARAVGGLASYGLDAVPGGLTLCHGFGAPLDALVLASETWGVEEHLDAARAFAAELVTGITTAAGDDPLAWPGGLPAEGSASLFLGLAGTAVTLARLIRPESVVSPSLLA